MEARFEPVDLAAFTADLASVFRSAMDRAGLAFEVDCAELPAAVYIDREMWEKVVLNLLSNALKFTLDGTISVSLRAEGTDAVLRISDTGSGIAAAEMPQLFERFHRIPTVRSRSNEGSGIGLALVRELVGLHGGTITAQSTEGAGTTFTVRLRFGHEHLPEENLAAAGPELISAVADPFLAEALRWLPGDQPDEPTLAADEVGGPPRRDLAGRDLAGRGAPARVLLADDNADMRGYLQRLLQPGYQVTAVADGQEALDAIRAQPFDLVISDVMMPGLDGLQLVGELRANSRTPDLPVLLLSARAGQEAAIEGLEAGADDYLVKPFSSAELLARVRATVELARLRSHHARWRAALIDSLHEAFFLCDEAGRVIEINATFTAILGYGPDGLPYASPYPWWPDQDADPEARRQSSEAFAQLMEQSKGGFVAPVTHRDGRRRWIAASFNEVQDPDSGRRMVVGSLRDITAEHYAGQREAALAAMGLLLSQANSLPEALQGALNELRRLWHARRVIAATWTGAGAPSLTFAAPAAAPATATSSAGRSCLTSSARRSGTCASGPCSPRPTERHRTWVSASSTRRGSWPSGSTWIRPGRSRPRTGRCSRCCAGISARRCTGPTRRISSGKPPSPCSAPSSARPGCPRASPPATSRPAARSRWGVTGTTWSNCPTGGSASWSATVSGMVWRPRP